MKDWLLKSLVVAFLALVVLRAAPPVPISSVVTQKQDFFTAHGEGKVTAVPDTAIVDLGISASETTVKTAQSKANAVISEITKAVKSLGISESDIKTSNYSIHPQYDYQPGRVNRITGYQVNATLAITVREIDKVNQVIDLSTAKGANTIGGVQLTVNPNRLKELTQQAREKAVSEAKSKAESLAKAAGISLVRIINVQENPPIIPVPVPLAEKATSWGGGGESTQIQPGSTDIVSTVTLTYETR